QRTDRATTRRLWEADGPPSAQNKTYLKALRNAEMPALTASTELLESLRFNGKDRLLPALRQSATNLTSLQTEFESNIDGPKAARRSALGDDYATEGLALQDTLQRIASSLFASIKNSDPFIVQMMEVKQLAWLTREALGE